MSDFLKETVKNLHDILSPLTKKLSDPMARKQFQQSLGYSAGENAAEPVFPNGSAMERYYKNENPREEEVLFAQAMQEVAAVIDALSEMYRTGADTYYAIRSDEAATREERVQMAVSELVTMTLNIFTMDYIRLRYPILHNVFIISGIVDEMGQRAGGSGFLGKVIYANTRNFLRGFKLADEKSVNTAIEALGLFLNVLKFVVPDANFFFSGGFETYENSSKKFADNASKGILSLGWFFQHDEMIKGNFYLTLGLIARTRAGGGFFAKVSSPGKFEKKFGEQFSLGVDAVGELDFFYASDIDFDVPPGQANRVSLIFKATPTPKNIKLLSAPELSVGYGREHSLELRFSRDELGILVKSDINIKFGRGEATSFPMGFIPESQFEKSIPVLFGWTTKRDFFVTDAGSVGTPPAKEDKPESESEAVAKTGQAPDGSGATSQPEDAEKPNLFFFNVPIKTGFKGLTFQNVHIGVGKDGDTTIVETSLDFKFVLGDAFVLAVTRIGGRGYFIPREDNKGFLGNDINLDFKAPTGIGITVDTGPVKGGGFLSLDRDKGEYFGALELAIDIKCLEFTLKAFGLIQTKLPGASKDDYSLFVVISTEFEPIPLVFGLTLNGVGGLFGHNRTADISLIQSEMRSPSLENILFLKDPIANISKLITETGRYFPAAIDKSLIGISLIIGYGGVFELKLALIFVKPDKKILVPGFLHLETPKKSKILHLQVNFLGIIDQQEGYFFFRADLVDSSLASFKLTGSLIFATGWGASEGLFVITLGGFHPSFKDYPEIKALPNAFKALDRLRIAFWDEGKNHLYMECYFACTPNSWQFGGHLYLHVHGPAGFNIDGHLGLDVLWDPGTYLEASIDARIDFRHNDDVLAGVGLTGLLTGFTPKHIEGKVRLKICWFLTVSIPFSKTWGEVAPLEENIGVDLETLLLEQINDDRNWRAEVPEAHHLHVSLRKSGDGYPEKIIIQPLGKIIFSQRALPLDQEIQKVGARKPGNPKRLTISKVSGGGAAFADVKPTNELFAPGHYMELNDDEKLSRPSFERMTSGIKIGDTGVSHFPKPFVKARSAEYELTYIAPDLPAKKTGGILWNEAVFQRLSRHSAIAGSQISRYNAGGTSTLPKAINLKAAEYAIGGTDELRLFTALKPQGFKSKNQSEAEQIKKQLLQDHPELKGVIQVLPVYELQP